MLLIDTALRVGEIVVRCALPFTAEFAVYLDSLDAVLVVSVEGFMAAYEVRLGRLTPLSEVPLARPAHRSWASSTRSAESNAPDLTDPASAERITVVAVSPYDPVLAVGTSFGFAMLFTMAMVKEALASRAGTRWRSRSPSTPSNRTSRPPSQRRDSAPGYSAKSPKKACDALDRAGGRADFRTSQAGGLANFPLRGEGESLEGEGAADLVEAQAAQHLPLIQQATRVEITPLHGRRRWAVLDLKFAPSVLLAGLKDGSLMAARLIPGSLRRTFVQPVPFKVDI
ncbi:unnamed protein product [Phytomonas sp. Hart1]|nr:unnamed protein product [Phytomonas sp. Hart1]|eukprot:CCW72089.1 unnamed protein product [Phytomonas sp. isolate Hart1]